ncbi:hypothetical protein [Buttiauxella sp.]|uniref:hypothetical protein n=1 Tax=Buttiauxella sp. TaxID=1972222 RepID=UPI003C79559C
MNWLMYMGCWWSITATEIKNTFELIAFGHSSRMRITKDVLRIVMRKYWGLSVVVA